MEGLGSVCKVVVVVVTLVALYGAWMANFGMMGSGVGSMEGSVALIALVVALHKCCKVLGCCDGK